MTIRILQEQLLFGNIQCFKITQKVSFNNASEASYVYIMSTQKFMKNTKNGQFGDFWKTEATVHTVLPDMPFFN